MLQPGSPENRPGPLPVQKIKPQTRILLVAQSTAGIVPAIPAPGREHSDLQGHEGLVLPESGSPGAGLRAALPKTWTPAGRYAPACTHSVCPLTCLLCPPSAYRESAGIRKQAFPSANPSFTTDRLRDLGQVISPPQLFPRSPERT